MLTGNGADDISPFWQEGRWADKIFASVKVVLVITGLYILLNKGH